jgi:GT2 family glycosyltransferase
MWLNDDVVLNQELKRSLPNLLKKHEGHILVGEIYNYADEFQYGLIYQGLLKDNLQACKSNEKQHKNPVAFNGNFVLISSSAKNAIGLIDGGFSHGYADIDYGLRASKEGIPILPVPGISGWVNSRTSYGINQTNHAFSQLINNPKGQPMRDQIRFFRRHAAILWWLYVSIPFLRILKFKCKNLLSRNPVSVE